MTPRPLLPPSRVGEPCFLCVSVYLVAWDGSTLVVSLIYTLRAWLLMSLLLPLLLLFLFSPHTFFLPFRSERMHSDPAPPLPFRWDFFSVTCCSRQHSLALLYSVPSQPTILNSYKRCDARALLSKWFRILSRADSFVEVRQEKTAQFFLCRRWSRLRLREENGF